MHLTDGLDNQILHHIIKSQNIGSDENFKFIFTFQQQSVNYEACWCKVNLTLK